MAHDCDWDFGLGSHAPFLLGGIMKKLLETIYNKLVTSSYEYQLYEDLYYMS